MHEEISAFGLGQKLANCWVKFVDCRGKHDPNRDPELRSMNGTNPKLLPKVCSLRGLASLAFQAQGFWD